MLRRFAPFIVVGGLVILFFLTVFSSRGAWKRIPQAVGLGEEYGEPTEEQKLHALPDLRTGNAVYEDVKISQGAFKEPKVESTSPYPVGQLKPAGSNYTKCLVVPHLKNEDTSWIEGELGDMLESGALSTAVYTVDDRSAELHPPKNKGHEVVVYLSYIIDFYDELADVNIFMHWHRYAWHNNDLMEMDGAQMVRHLSSERVTREGYMNLRCHWDPGCPDWMHPGATEKDRDKPEEMHVANAWAQLFPLDPIPKILAQPCCAQFAVSRDRIQALPKQRYVILRDWILRTELSDYMSGRVFEYVWQFIFTAAPVHCPSMSACYCDGYGYCFGSPEAFDHWFELRYERHQHEETLKAWREQAGKIHSSSKDGQFDEEADLEVPEIGQNFWLQDRVEEIQAEMDELKRAAFERGKDPLQRALEAGRTWQEGDGF